MRPKDRVLATVDHREPDRVPMDMWEPPDADFKARLGRHFGARDYEHLLEILELDVRYVSPRYVGPELRTYEDGSVDDPWGVRRKTVPNVAGSYEEMVYMPLAGATTVEEIDGHRWPDPDWWDYSPIREGGERYSDYAVAAGSYVGPFWYTWGLRSLDRVLMDTMESPEIVDALVRGINGFLEPFLERIFEAGGGKIDLLALADDLGTQQGPMMSLATWRRFFAEPLRRLVAIGKRHHARIFLHSCGSVRQVIPGLVEAGIEILNPIQVRAAGMVPRELKAEFGQQLCFHGSIDIQHTLPYGTPDDVRREVEDRIRDLAPGGGFILAPTHRLQADTPPENVEAMFFHGRAVGRYR